MWKYMISGLLAFFIVFATPNAAHPRESNLCHHRVTASTCIICRPSLITPSFSPGGGSGVVVRSPSIRHRQGLTGFKTTRHSTVVSRARVLPHSRHYYFTTYTCPKTRRVTYVRYYYSTGATVCYMSIRRDPYTGYEIGWDRIGTSCSCCRIRAQRHPVSGQVVIIIGR